MEASNARILRAEPPAELVEEIRRELHEVAKRNETTVADVAGAVLACARGSFGVQYALLASLRAPRRGRRLGDFVKASR